jgi:hypothetical protein
VFYSAIFKLQSREGGSGRTGSVKNCGYDVRGGALFMEFGYNTSTKMCEVSETQDGISFDCNHRDRGSYLIGKFSGTKCTDCKF